MHYNDTCKVIVQQEQSRFIAVTIWWLLFYTVKGESKVIKLNIMNMTEFLRVVNGCSGVVELLHPDGTVENINKQYNLQQKLQRRYRENNRYLTLALNIPSSKDYMSIVFFTVGDC